ncbi:MAG TPA: phosphoribosylaminoimidazolesuccinocarboxamide synthase, partial [Spirochaetaceae bacterium]|nr:phosphoribosylaminoimidazolesuccinocarboxamide synthase [Spirochaetaceae bacterium]
RVLSSIPWKGEVLARVSSWWFEQTSDIMPNHILKPADCGGLDVLAATGRAVAARRCDMLPVELVVRGYLTGSAWRDYKAGRPVSGLSLPGGLRYNERFPAPIVTPSTKEASGHDKPCSGQDLVASGAIDAELWREVERSALALFARGQELAGARGLILVDTKYEFGLADGRLLVADEMHTPDSSRYWYAEGYASRLAAGDQQRELDKETFRRWLVEHGFSGDGPSPLIDDAVRAATALRYFEAYHALLGDEFEPICADAQAAERALASSLRGVFTPS